MLLLVVPGLGVARMIFAAGVSSKSMSIPVTSHTVGLIVYFGDGKFALSLIMLHALLKVRRYRNGPHTSSKWLLAARDTEGATVLDKVQCYIVHDVSAGGVVKVHPRAQAVTAQEDGIESGIMIRWLLEVGAVAHNTNVSGKPTQTTEDANSRPNLLTRRRYGPIFCDGLDVEVIVIVHSFAL